MKILGIDASHRNTGIVVIDTIPGSFGVKSIDLHATLTTNIAGSVLEEYAQLFEVIEQINKYKFLHGVYTCVCEVAHSGRSFASSRNVGITWGIAAATKSVAYTQHQVRKLFPGKEHAKERAKRWAMKHNFHLISTLTKMDDHQIDAFCVALYHTTQH